jgi:hypothetical protein
VILTFLVIILRRTTDMHSTISTFTGDAVPSPTPTATGSDSATNGSTSDNGNATTTGQQIGSAPRSASVSNLAVMTSFSLVLAVLAMITL